MGTLGVGVGQEGLGHLRERAWPMQKPPLFLVGAVEPFHGAMCVWTMRRADLWLDQEAEQETDQSRGKVTPAGTAHPARITENSSAWGQAIASQELHHSLQSRFCREVFTHGRKEPHRGACIDKIACFDNMLMLAPRIGRHRQVIGCQSIWISCIGSRRSKGLGLRRRSTRMRSLLLKIFHIVLVERGKWARFRQPLRVRWQVREQRFGSWLPL